MVRRLEHPWDPLEALWVATWYFLPFFMNIYLNILKQSFACRIPPELRRVQLCIRWPSALFWTLQLMEEGWVGHPHHLRFNNTSKLNETGDTCLHLMRLQGNFKARNIKERFDQRSMQAGVVAVQLSIGSIRGVNINSYIPKCWLWVTKFQFRPVNFSVTYLSFLSK